MEFRKGLKDGIPIALGYFAVSFSFGLLAVKGGLTSFQAVIISLTNVTLSLIHISEPTRH